MCIIMGEARNCWAGLKTQDFVWTRKSGDWPWNLSFKKLFSKFQIESFFRNSRLQVFEVPKLSECFQWVLNVVYGGLERLQVDVGSYKNNVKVLFQTHHMVKL